MTADTQYLALLDGEDGAFGIVFPDIAGCAAMGRDPEVAQANGAEALRDWVETAEAFGRAVPRARAVADLLRDAEVVEALKGGAVLLRVPLVRELSRSVKTNLSLDSGVLASIDAAARRRGVTRSALVEILARRHLRELV